MATVIAGVSGAIGSALAQRYLEARPEQSLIGLCRHPERVPQALRQDSRVHLLAWSADSQGQVLMEQGLQALLDAGGGVEDLIYAAGLLHDDGLFPEKRLDELNPDNLARAFEVNCIGFGMLVKTLAGGLRGKHLKRVVAVSAKVGSITDNQLGGWYAYRCSKAALNMMVKNLSVELPRRYAPVACVALHPGTTRSALSEPFSQSLAKLMVHEPSETADNLFGVIQSLSEADNGRFISWDGRDLPW
ncbi:SDR family NAD(P)-dependent oxidoreductase [Marinobacter sp.]|uniref:SDR family NAD(P)-dependent oxidoreductase n=1 Tax=Marinobacter sp. TaxID=50741 RepID=UPI0019FFDBDE|nr:SDR family NAD(P)-dependent oxidoreductase [Marinobacter sp.]MBE0484687.1 SDR family NAD(P)-dependent oxidoreductase [Marinobacter sp.]